MEILLNLGTAILGGLVVAAGWLLTTGRRFQILDDLKKKVDSIEAFEGSAANAIVEIQTHLTGKGFIINQRLAYTSSSPLKLTEFGEEIIKQSGFSKIIAEESKRKLLVDLVRAKNPQTNYDIQDMSMKVMEELAQQNSELIIPLKNYAYEKGLTLEIVLNSAAILLRDEAMKGLTFQDTY